MLTASNLALTKERVLFWLRKFRTTDIADKAERQRLIDSFLNAIYLHEDKIVLFFNFKDGTKTVTLSYIEGSDLSCNTAPATKKSEEEKAQTDKLAAEKAEIEKAEKEQAAEQAENERLAAEKAATAKTSPPPVRLTLQSLKTSQILMRT